MEIRRCDAFRYTKQIDIYWVEVGGDGSEKRMVKMTSALKPDF
jgi:hypothetical protein